MGDILKQYEILCPLAEGGTAELHLARSKGVAGVGKLLVIKRIRSEHARNELLRRMFLDEARILARLQHTNIVQVYDVDEEGGSPFLVMEFLNGQDVSTLYNRAREKSGALLLEHTLSIGVGVCSGLHFAHEKHGPDRQPLGIIHRDISPHNVFVTYDGAVKLIDFGIAKATNRLDRTEVGTRKGKLGYMSPEQAVAEPVDRRTDIFCVGILLWELATGRRLFGGRNEFEILKKIVDGKPVPPSQVAPGFPKPLEKIIMKTLARKPEARYQTAEELQRELEGFASSKGLVLSPSSLSRYMKDLFADEIAAFRRALLGPNFDPAAAVEKTIVARTRALEDLESEPSLHPNMLLPPPAPSRTAPEDDTEPTDLWPGGRVGQASDTLQDARAVGTGSGPRTMPVGDTLREEPALPADARTPMRLGGDTQPELAVKVFGGSDAAPAPPPQSPFERLWPKARWAVLGVPVALVLIAVAVGLRSSGPAPKAPSSTPAQATTEELVGIGPHKPPPAPAAAAGPSGAAPPASDERGVPPSEGAGAAAPPAAVATEPPAEPAAPAAAAAPETPPPAAEEDISVSALVGSRELEGASANRPAAAKAKAKAKRRRAAAPSRPSPAPSSAAPSASPAQARPRSR
jgi:serine/threonine protein kinase